MKGRTLTERLGFACRGVWVALRREKSLRTQVACLALVIAAMAWLHAAPMWWALMLVAAALVVVAELLNTALETLADHLHPDQHPAIGEAKDIAAGAVLTASGFALAVAVAWLFSLLP